MGRWAFVICKYYAVLNRRDLSIRRFWYPQGVLEPIPCEYQGMTEITQEENFSKEISECSKALNFLNRMLQIYEGSHDDYMMVRSVFWVEKEWLSRERTWGKGCLTVTSRWH